MADLPEASVTIDDVAGAQAGGTELIAVLAAVPTSADVMPRIFASTAALIAKHGYAAGVDYCALHFEEASKPVLFVPLPIVTAGSVGSLDGTGNTGTSRALVAAASGGVLEETSGVVEVVTGGTVGTDQIMLSISLDGGATFTAARLGTATSYTLPYVGLVLTFTTGGTLVAGDTVLTFVTTAPTWDQAGLAAGRAALAAQQKQIRSMLVIGDMTSASDATAVATQVNAYETANDRFVFARAQVTDRKRGAALSRVRAVMTGAPALTFAEVGGTGDTCTRATGSWITDGFSVGDVVTFTGTASNNVTGPIASLSATVMTMGTTDFAAESTSVATVVASSGITFAEVGVSGDTITRSSGSWITDGFAAGDTITIAASALNNGSGSIASLTATVMTMGTYDLTAEVIGAASITITTAAELKADATARNDHTFGDIDGQRRIDLGLGRARKASPITGYRFRRPVQWAASVREYQHDVHVPTWRKSLGPLPGWSLEDEDGNTVEHDERIDGGGLAARFTCFRTYANGPLGAYIALSLTRAGEGKNLSRTHNMAVADVASSVVQAATENWIGETLQLKADGTATEASLRVLEERANSELQIALLQGGAEGPRASDARWTASRTDVLNVADAALNGTLDLRLGKALERITTRIRVS